MSAKAQAEHLLAHFVGPFLEGFSRHDKAVLSSLEHCRCVTTNEPQLKLRFKLANLFEAIWHHAKSQGAGPTEEAPWNTCFRAFCTLLMFPWPTRRFEALGFQLHLIHKSNSNARTEYELVAT